MMGRPGGALSLWLVAILGMTLTTARSETIQVTVSDLKFLPERIEARVGDTVEWVNADILAHTATAQGRWDVMIPPKGAGRVVLKKAGEIAYYCRFHPNMTANIVIAERDRK
jgi:plastocyanin